jgi:hypothetical protein
MFDATKLPTEPCDPKTVDTAKQPEPAPQYARAPDGDGHAAALRPQGVQR